MVRKWVLIPAASNRRVSELGKRFMQFTTLCRQFFLVALLRILLAEETGGGKREAG